MATFSVRRDGAAAWLARRGLRAQTSAAMASADIEAIQEIVVTAREALGDVCKACRCR